MAARILKHQGAVMVEFAIASGVFLLLVMGFFDLTRIQGARLLLQRSTQKGLELAKKIQALDSDMEELGCLCRGAMSQRGDHNPAVPMCRAATVTDAARCIRTLRAKELIIRSAENLAATTFMEDWRSDGAIRLQCLDSSEKFTSGMTYERYANAAILRPGEKFAVGCGVQNAEVIQHPTWPGTVTMPMSRMLQQQPLVVEMHAEVKTILPFLGTIPISARAVGFYEGSVKAVNPGQGESTTAPPSGTPQVPPCPAPPAGGCQFPCRDINGCCQCEGDD